MQSNRAEPLRLARVRCAIAPTFSELIGAAMQYLALQESDPGASFDLVVNAGPAHAAISALAGAAGISVSARSSGEAVAPPFWKYEDRDAVARLKESLHRPQRVYELLLELAVEDRDEALRLSRLHDRAIHLLGLDSLINSRRKLHKLETRSESLPPDRRIIVPAATSGLANRMLLISGALRIAELTGRRMVLHWPANDQLGCSLEHLFTNRFDLLKGNELQDFLRTDRTVKVYNAWGSAPLYTDIAADGDPEADAILIKGWIFPKFPYEYYDAEFYRAAHAYLRRFEPQPRIAAIAAGFALPPKCVGVHIRRGDNQAEFWQSADDHFIAIVEALLTRSGDASFLLATDDAATEEKFCLRFPNRMIAFPKERKSKTTPEGMDEALVDLLLLGRTAAIIGNHFSTFTHAAAALTGIPVLIAEEKSAGAGLAQSVEMLLAALSTKEK